MRQIKFRAWDGVDMFEPVSINFAEGKLHIGSEAKPYWHLMKDCPLMQYTGLKDKNGKEIYAGDILSKQGAYVMWGESVSAWCFTFKGSPDYTPLFHEKHYPINLEVLGNIYENKDLLAPESLEARE